MLHEVISQIFDKKKFKIEQKVNELMNIIMEGKRLTLITYYKILVLLELQWHQGATMF